MAKLDERIGFIGGGNMAYAIGSGLINRGKIESSAVPYTFSELCAVCVYRHCKVNASVGVWTEHRESRTVACAGRNSYRRKWRSKVITLRRQLRLQLTSFEGRHEI